MGVPRARFARSALTWRGVSLRCPPRVWTWGAYLLLDEGSEGRGQTDGVAGVGWHGDDLTEARDRRAHGV